jgi:hypothetical protein
MVLVLYALSLRFFLNVKDAFIESRQFALHPNNFYCQVERILGSLGDSRVERTRDANATRRSPLI